MPDNKFERKDRQLTDGDLKARILDMQANPFVVPDVAWDAQPVRYFKLNLQWCKILAGWLEWMEDVSGWADADDELHAGIQGFLTFERGINGSILMTPDEFKQSLYEGLYQWSNDVAKQIVSGRTFGFSVDEDGNPIVDGSDGDSGLPEDDPTTPGLNETYAAKAGGVIAVTDGYNAIWADMNAWKTAGLSEDVVSYRLQQKYLMVDDPLTDLFVAQYFLAYGFGHINSYQSSLHDMLFCSDGNYKNVVADYIIESITFELQENAFALNNALSDAQITAWFNFGAEIPSQAYYAYSCVPIEPETFVLDMSSAEAPQVSSVQNLKLNHRYKFSVSGQFTDSDNPDLIGDFFYMHDTALGTKTYRSTNPFNSAGMNQPNSSQVPWRADGVYVAIVDKLGNANPVIVSRDNSPMNLPNTTGSLTIIMEDLGEFAI